MRTTTNNISNIFFKKQISIFMCEKKIKRKYFLKKLRIQKGLTTATTTIKIVFFFFKFKTHRNIRSHELFYNCIATLATTTTIRSISFKQCIEMQANQSSNRIIISDGGYGMHHYGHHHSLLLSHMVFVVFYIGITTDVEEDQGVVVGS